MNQKQGRKFRKWLVNSVKVLVLALFLLWTVVPILLVILTSLKNQKDIFTVPPTFVFRPTLDNYSRALIAGDFARYFLNSALVARFLRSCRWDSGLFALTPW